jgi:hypothetical protein
MGMTAKRIGAGMVLAVLGLLLAGCFVLPGRFRSELDLHRDGTFRFAYKGEITLLALSKLAKGGMGGASGAKDDQVAVNETFMPSACEDAKSGDSRPCTKAEVDAQRAAWESERGGRQAKKSQEDQAMKAMLGGIDPADPRAAQDLADRLSRQAGWRSVVNKGDGKFDVDFAITGRLDHDFTFPTMERMPVVTPFVTLIRRADGSVRVDAPAFSGAASGGPFGAMMGAMAQDKSAAKTDSPGMPEMDGTLILRTDGEILANNTDEGPRADPLGKRLDWHVTMRTTTSPTALVRLGTK